MLRIIELLVNMITESTKNMSAARKAANIMMSIIDEMRIGQASLKIEILPNINRIRGSIENNIEVGIKESLFRRNGLKGKKNRKSHQNKDNLDQIYPKLEFYIVIRRQPSIKNIEWISTDKTILKVRDREKMTNTGTILEM